MPKNKTNNNTKPSTDLSELAKALVATPQAREMLK